MRRLCSRGRLYHGDSVGALVVESGVMNVMYGTLGLLALDGVSSWKLGSSQIVDCVLDMTFLPVDAA